MLMKQKHSLVCTWTLSFLCSTLPSAPSDCVFKNNAKLIGRKRKQMLSCKNIKFLHPVRVNITHKHMTM